MARDKDWYDSQIVGLIMILESSSDYNIERDYVIQKLKFILTDGGINFHPAIRECLGIDYKGDRIGR